MTGARTSLERGGPRRVVRLCREGLDSVTLRRKLRAELERLVAFDAYCVNTADPATLLVTGSVGDGLPPEKTQRLFEIEYGLDDVHKLADLATRGVRAAVLGQATGGRPEASARMREIFLPVGLAHELRAPLLVDGTCWGFLHLLRARDRPDFGAADVRAVTAITEPVAEALRMALLVSPAARESPEAPGIVLLDERGQVQQASEAAQHWLAELSDEVHRPLPHALAVVAARVAEVDAPSPPRCRLRTRSGEWLLIHGSRLGQRIAIVIERARPAEVAPVVLRAYGLTPREREVAALVIRGHANEGIADALGLSLHTAKDHLKAIFAKVGVGSRGELVSRVFVEDYAPRIARGTALGADGWFTD